MAAKTTPKKCNEVDDEFSRMMVSRLRSEQRGLNNKFADEHAAPSTRKEYYQWDAERIKYVEDHRTVFLDAEAKEWHARNRSVWI